MMAELRSLVGESKGFNLKALEPFRAEGLHQAMYIVPILAAVLAAVLFAASRTVKNDVDTLQAWMRSGSLKSEMNLAGKIVVVTGGGNGIGRALCRRFAAEGAKAVVVADLSAASAAQVADEIGGVAITADVSREADVARLVTRTIAECGAIDLSLCASASLWPSSGGHDRSVTAAFVLHTYFTVRSSHALEHSSAIFM